MNDDEALDAAVTEARRALRDMPPSNGAIADMLPPELHGAFMMRSIGRYLAAHPDSESGPSIFDTMDGSPCPPSGGRCGGRHDDVGSGVKGGQARASGADPGGHGRDPHMGATASPQVET